MENQKYPITGAAMKAHSFRLTPGEDLKLGIEQFVADRDIQAGCILTCVGGLSTAVLRSADVGLRQQDTHRLPGYQENNYEITSLVGTVSVNGVHLHMSIADSRCQGIGGHLQEGSIVHPTAEIVIGELVGLVYTREPDPVTGYNELRVSEA